MCGRYRSDSLIFNNAAKEIGINRFVPDYPAQNICPGQEAYILTGSNNAPEIKKATWGFHSNGKLIINARSETVLQKPMFESSFLSRRCIIPASCFYEWDSDKNMATFINPDIPVMYLAGFWNMILGIYRFVILTVAANESVSCVHERMPLMINERDIEEWMANEQVAIEYLVEPMPILKYEIKQEQISFL